MQVESVHETRQPEGWVENCVLTIVRQCSGKEGDSGPLTDDEIELLRRTNELHIPEL